MSGRFASTGFSESEHRAIERFLTARTVPLAYEANGQAFVQGTGAFYRVGSDFFLVTAAHVLDGIDPALLGVPDRPNGNVSVWNLNDLTIYHPRDTENFDVAIIELLNPNFRTHVTSSWQYVDDAEIVSDIDCCEEFLLAGYPSETVEDRNGTLTPAPMLQLFTGRYEGQADESPSEHDLLLRYKRTAKGLRGDERATPDLRGVSGAIVYAKSSPASTVWSPESVFRPVGIQVSMKHSEYIRVKRWSLIRRLVQLVQQQRA